MATEQQQPSDQTEDTLRERLEQQEDIKPSVGEYTWIDFIWEYGDDETISQVSAQIEDGVSSEAIKDEIDWDSIDWSNIDINPEEYLGFAPEDTENVLALGDDYAAVFDELVDERTVDVNEDLDEDEFFSTFEGGTTLVNRYDLEKAVPMENKKHFREIERYWVNKPYAFVVIFHSDRENEKKYYVIEPYQTKIEEDLKEFITKKLRTAIKYSSEEVVVEGDDSDRREVIERETKKLLDRYDLYEGDFTSPSGFIPRIQRVLGMSDPSDTGSSSREGLPARPEPAILEDDPETLNEYQVEKLLYYLKRDFVGYERIDGIKHDINIEDISCDGYNSPVFVYHTDYENLITNISHGKESLDDFVVTLAQRSGKGISKRQPQVDATLPDGSRAQLTLGEEVSGHGTNYTIRQFNDVPFTPVDLINWHTFSLEQMAFLWLCIENNKSLIFAGGTASGKTTSLNAASLFIPSNTKIVSIEDTREVELPQRNWVSSVTRPSFSEEDRGDIDEFDLLEAALRQRPDYIIMGEVRGEEGRDLFQIMSTGHTTYTTFHADNVSEVLKRFTTDPINVSKTLFTALDLISVQSVTRVQGKKVRRNRLITEINEYNAENDEINVQDVFQWQPATDEFQRQPGSNTLEEIMFDRGWSADRLEKELFKREVVLSYLIQNNLNEYGQVAASLQAFISDPDTILALIAQDKLEQSLENLRQMESVIIDVDPQKEEMVPRPDPTENVLDTTANVLEEARDGILAEYEDVEADIIDALTQTEEEEDIIAQAVEERTQLQEITQATVEENVESPDQTVSTANGGEVQPPTEETEEETEEEVTEPESPEEQETSEESEPPEEPESPEEQETSEESEPDEASETAEEPTEEESGEAEEDEFEIFESALVDDEEDDESTSDTEAETDNETTEDSDEEGSS